MAENYLCSLLLWPGFTQLKYSFGFADSSPSLLPNDTRSVGFALPDAAHASLGRRNSAVSSSSVLLTACQTPRCPTVPCRPFLCFSTDGPNTSTRRISSTTRGLGAFHWMSPEDAVQIFCTAVSMPRTRNLRNLLDHLQRSLPASQCKHTVQLY